MGFRISCWRVALPDMSGSDNNRVSCSMVLNSFDFSVYACGMRFTKVNNGSGLMIRAYVGWRFLICL